MTTLDFQNYEYFTHAVTVGGKILEVPLRKGQKDSAFIDALTFTIKKQTIDILKGLCITDLEYVAAYSEILQEIFGFGVSEKVGKGRYFYNAFYRLGTKEAEYGTLHIGGQRETILIELTGTGCQAAKPGWEKRLYEFLIQAVRPRITRIDCAHDFFNGEYSPEQAMLDHNKGLFNRANKRPKSECKGTAWREEDYTGKTFYIGRRGSSKLVRVYEKGRQLGDKDSQWTRFEIEFRNKDCVIPLEILTAPGEFLTGAYPVGETLFTTTAQSIEAATEKVNITFDSKLAHAKNQVGRMVRFLNDIGWTPEQIIEALIGEEDKYPKGLNPEEYDCDKAQVHYLTTEDIEYTELPTDELDEVIKMETAIRIFDQDTQSKTDWQKQLIAEFPDDFKRWLDIWKQQKYYGINQHLREAENLRREQESHLDYLYSKYGTLFSTPTKRTTSCH
ncbi:replication initiation factor domain-containing protein [Wielerella bovis]|uniref:replication initiation factor domain-containing protein n=1 Tax=Wielerella bovis TaxID=2917790 RepID=UPI0020189A40|nr:replication initiation factor domain-containing protein [Wielerella bovis]ULJ60112.1 replication initiation factor domain-containing protein [Wielerella bovis]